MAKVLVTGGTGLVGSSLVPTLESLGYEVFILSTSKKSAEQNKNISFWDPTRGIVDEKLVQSTDYIIHLAGYNLMTKRWNDAVKKEIIESRVDSAKMLYSVLKEKNNLKAFISSSGVGYYGAVTNDKVYTEVDEPYNDFVSNVCVKWEGVADLFQGIGARVVKLRIGIVLARNGGAIPQMSFPVKLGIGSALGSGKQYMPWIHIEDLVSVFTKAITDEQMKGVYNTASPEDVTNNQFTKELANILTRPYFFPKVPAFVLKVLFGEMGALMLEGSRVSSEKLQKSGFEFKYFTLNKALENLFSKEK